MTMIINMFGGPGRGKSTYAYLLAGLLKLNNYKAELVVEFVKFSAYKKAGFDIQDQLYLTTRYNHFFEILNKQVDVIVTDSSLLHSLAYADDINQNKTEIDLATALYNKWDNVGFVIPRKATYLEYGRSQTKEEAVQLDKKIFELIKDRPEIFDLSYLEHNENYKLGSTGIKNNLVLDTMYAHVLHEMTIRDIKPAE